MSYGENDAMGQGTVVGMGQAMGEFGRKLRGRTWVWEQLRERGPTHGSGCGLGIDVEVGVGMDVRKVWEDVKETATV